MKNWMPFQFCIQITLPCLSNSNGAGLFDKKLLISGNRCWLQQKAILKDGSNGALPILRFFIGWFGILKNLERFLYESDFISVLLLQFNVWRNARLLSYFDAARYKMAVAFLAISK